MYNQKISSKIRMRALKGAENGSIINQVILDGKAYKISMGLSWPPKYFDSEKECLLPRFDKDELCYQLNMRLANEKAKTNKLIMRFYVAEQPVTFEQFKKALKNYTSKEDVVGYFRNLAADLRADNLVSAGTMKNYTTIFNRTDIYFESRARWTFNTLSMIDIQRYEVWIRENYSHNTVCGTMRVFNKFFNICTKEGLIVKNPMEDYRMPSFSEGIRDVLEPHELSVLTEYFANGKMTDHERDVLRRYLIACYTGLRKSDIEQLDPRFHIRNSNILRVSMFKTRKYGKTVEFNLPKIAVTLIGKKRGRIFEPMESALLGKTLRKIAERAGLEKYLKFHSGRDTFATIYIGFGGNLVDLQEILGHADIKTTMIYAKMTSRTKNNTMSYFDKLC